MKSLNAFYQYLCMFLTLFITHSDHVLLMPDIALGGDTILPMFLVFEFL